MSRREIDRYGNGYRLNRMNPVMVEGEVVQSCFPDPGLMDQKKRNQDVYPDTNHIYPGGSDDYNNYISRGEVVVALRQRQDYHDGATELPQVYAVSSANGLPWHEYGSHDAMVRDYYCVGFAKTNYRVNDPDQPEHGFPAYVAGNYTTAFMNDWKMEEPEEE